MWAERGVTGVDVDITFWLINYNCPFQYTLSEHGDSWFLYPRKLYIFGKGLQKQLRKCNKKVNKGVACDKCNVWFHGPCVNLTSDQLSVLESLKTTCWYCDSCYEARAESFELKEKICSIQESLNDLKNTKRKSSDLKFDIQKESLSRFDNHRYKVKIVGVPENNLRFSNDRKPRDKEIIEDIATELNLHNVQVSDCHRKGKFNNSKRRPVIVTFSSIWDARRVVRKIIERKLFQEKGILVQARLSPSDQEIERCRIAKRYTLINDGTDKSRIKIRNLKLYIDGKENAHNDNWLVQPLKIDILLNNVRSLCSFENQVKLANRLALLDADAACLTGTWLNSLSGDSIIFSSSYSTSARVARATGEHWGCLVFTKKTIYIDQIDSTVDFGCATILHTSCQDLLLICIYNPPFSSKIRCAAIDIIKFLSHVINHNRNLPTVFWGDFNMPDVNWDPYHSHLSDSVRILNFLINHGFERIIMVTLLI